MNAKSILFEIGNLYLDVDVVVFEFIFTKENL